MSLFAEFIDFAIFPMRPQFLWMIPMSVQGLNFSRLSGFWRIKENICQFLMILRQNNQYDCDFFRNLNLQIKISRGPDGVTTNLRAQKTAFLKLFQEI